MNRTNIPTVQLLLLAFILSPFLSMSQINSSIDFVSGIDHTYRSLMTSEDNDISQGIINLRNDVESSKSNWRLGFNYNKRISDQMFFKTGIRLASLGYKGENQTGLRWGSEYNGAGEWIPDPSLPHEIQLVRDYWLIEIPIELRLEFNESGNKLFPFFEFGISPALNIGTQFSEITDIDKAVEFLKNDSDVANKFQLAGLFAIGCNYSITEQIQLFAQPSIRYYFTSLKEAVISERLYSFGIEFGARKRIN